MNSLCQPFLYCTYPDAVTNNESLERNFFELFFDSLCGADESRTTLQTMETLRKAFRDIRSWPFYFNVCIPGLTDSSLSQQFGCQGVIESFPSASFHLHKKKHCTYFVDALQRCCNSPRSPHAHGTFLCLSFLCHASIYSVASASGCISFFCSVCLLCVCSKHVRLFPRIAGGDKRETHRTGYSEDAL